MYNIRKLITKPVLTHKAGAHLYLPSPPPPFECILYSSNNSVVRWQRSQRGRRRRSKSKFYRKILGSWRHNDNDYIMSFWLFPLTQCYFRWHQFFWLCLSSDYNGLIFFWKNSTFIDTIGYFGIPSKVLLNWSFDQIRHFDTRLWLPVANYWNNFSAKCSHWYLLLV